MNLKDKIIIGLTVVLLLYVIGYFFIALVNNIVSIVVLEKIL